MIKRATTFSKSACSFNSVLWDQDHQCSECETSQWRVNIFQRNNFSHNSCIHSRLSAHVLTQIVGHACVPSRMRRMHHDAACGERGARKRNGRKGGRARGREKGSRARGRRKKASGAFIARLRSQRSAGWCPPTHTRYTSRGAASSARRSALGAG